MLCTLDGGGRALTWPCLRRWLAGLSRITRFEGTLPFHWLLNLALYHKHAPLLSSSWALPHCLPPRSSCNLKRRRFWRQNRLCKVKVVLPTFPIYAPTHGKFYLPPLIFDCIAETPHFHAQLVTTPKITHQDQHSEKISFVNILRQNFTKSQKQHACPCLFILFQRPLLIRRNDELFVQTQALPFPHLPDVCS